ncbi:copper resistance protein NlpE [Hymenobacter arizonensis]|uniref:Lipocalin-like domain-containing protein n=1 Tax=Hymenobacter arizonensis TaxID=1227077 RepID=A0A1I5WYU9_HYMAR|nr:copper resistance protein NlpE [Hymenobacter arizonensis]SFQ24801.1 hypothetical protein SAMN04515668_1557 [Hymenobacter arizonensis]
MKPHSLFSLRYIASLLMLLSLFTAACGNDKGKVEGVNMLYGTDSKVWKTAKELDTTGDKVKQTSAQKQEELRIFANGTYNMTGATGAVSGKYTFDQAGKTITMTPDGSATSNTFAVETLTDKKLTLKSAEGAALMLEAQ